MSYLNTVSLDRQAEMDRVSQNVHYQIAKNFTEQDAEGMKKYGSARLKSYTSATAHVKDREEEKNVQYKPGSIASKANALRDYYSKNEKE